MKNPSPIVLDKGSFKKQSGQSTSSTSSIVAHFYRKHQGKYYVSSMRIRLGPYMAKKVIFAQGGSIIFKSIEDKGSTFGFSFPKTEALVAPAKQASI